MEIGGSSNLRDGLGPESRMYVKPDQPPPDPPPPKANPVLNPTDNQYPDESSTSDRHATSVQTLQDRFDTLEKLMNSRPAMFGGHSINCELLIDLLNAMHYECQNSGLNRNKNQQKFLELIEPLVQQINQLRLQSKDFDLIKVIGFGNFGQVSVVKSKTDGQVYAMKTLNKNEMLRRAETACYREERDILLHGNSHDWFTKLHYAFQDEMNLYLIMDYYIGGDLLTLFSKYDDFLPEEMSKFYSAQIVMAISKLHEMGYIHRDIKPDNILLDKDGQARLADFGSCIKVSNITSDGICTIAVGTPDYISPDVLKAMEGGKRSSQLYDYDVDWWSLGVVIFESLFGQTPFYAESLAETYSKIMSHEASFKFPDEPEVSDEAKDLISNLICCQSKRFRNLNQFKSHKWFDGIDWDNLRNVPAPYKPVVSGPDDTSNFDIDETRPSNPIDSKNNPLAMRGPKDSVLNTHLPFVGFSATFSAANRSNKPVQKMDSVTKDMRETISRAMDTIDGNVKDDEESGLPSSIKSTSVIGIGDFEINQVDIQQLESDLSLARQQWSELSALVNEIRKEKSLLSSNLRSKETELEEIIEKMSELRKSKANLDQIKRQQSDEIIRLGLELDRERRSNYSYQLELTNLESKIQTMQSELTIMNTKGPITDNNHLEVSDAQAAKDELISQQKDYIAHLEEQVLKLQQQQPNWDRQVAVFKNLDQHDNIYINTYQVDNKIQHSSSTTWQERRSAKAERHEFKELQLSLQNELEDKRRIQNDLDEKQRDLCQALADLDETRIELAKIRSEHQKLIQRRASMGHSPGNRPLPIVSQSMLFNPSGMSNPSRPTSNHQLSSSSIGSTSSNRHMFVVRTFIMPLKCNLCTSLMTGLIRQGLVCESCGFACHIGCAKSLVSIACPYDEKRPVGLDPQRGIGTAYSGYVQIPRPGGVRKGWMRIYVVVCDFKLFLYDLGGEPSSPGSSSVSRVSGGSIGRDDSLSGRRNSGVSVSRIIDLRDENFSVSSVLESDVIHASRTDISCIFRVGSSMIGDELSPHTHRSIFYQLMLVDKESERLKWIEALHELHRIVKRNNLSPRNVLAAYSVLTTSQLNQLRNQASIHCCAVIEDGPKLLIGSDEALICCYPNSGTYHRLSKGKRVLMLDVLEADQLIVAMSGRQRHIKLIPMRSLESDSVAWIKMPETKNATTFVVHRNLPGSFISVAVKKSLYVYEITRRQFRYAPWREIQSNATIQTLNSSGALISVGTCSNFHVHNILARDGPPLYLISAECADLVYIIQNPLEPLGCYQVSEDKWLLVFENHGVYVNSFGYKSQEADLQFVTKCNTIAALRLDNSLAPLILGFSTNHIDVYDSLTGEWLQTMNLKNSKPLQADAMNELLCVTGASDPPQLVQITRKGNSNSELVLELANQNKPFFSECGNETQRQLSRIYISEPSDFQHLTHLGPAHQPCLLDLNEAAASAVGVSSDK